MKRRARSCSPFPHDRDYAPDADHLPILPPDVEDSPDTSPETPDHPPVPGDAGQKEKQP
jgi:hypothetical protein